MVMTDRETAETWMASAINAAGDKGTPEERAHHAARAAHLAECVYWLRRDEREASAHAAAPRARLTVTGPVGR